MKAQTPGEALLVARYQTGFTLEELAGQLGTSPSMIYYVETGQRTFQPEWMKLLPSQIAVPVIRTVLRGKRAELDALEALLQAKIAEGPRQPLPRKRSPKAPAEPAR